MDFFGMGALEILLILVLALIIWGPGRLPEIARTMGKTMRTLRKATYDITSAVTREVENDHQLPQPKPKPAAAPARQTPGEAAPGGAPSADQPQPGGGKPPAEPPQPGGEAPAK